MPRLHGLMFALAACALGACAHGPIIGSESVAADAAHVKSNTLTYALPRVRSELQLVKTTGDAYRLRYVSDVVSPDPAHLYTVRYDASAFADDQVTVTTTLEGLLESVDVTNEDKTGAFLIELADAARQAAKMSQAFRTLAEAGTEKLIADLVVDLSDQGEVALVNERLAKAASGKVKARVSVVPDGPKVAMGPHHYAGATDCAASLCFRPALPYILTIDNGDGTGERRIVHYPNQAPIVGLDIGRASFVKKVTNITFDKGRIKSIKIVKPSEALGLATIPVEVLKIILSIPAELIQLRIDTTNKDKELAAAQKQLIEAQKQLIEARKQAIGEGESGMQ